MIVVSNSAPSAAQPALEPTAPSALVVSRLFGFVGKLVQSGDSVNPALRLSFSVRRALAMLAPPNYSMELTSGCASPHGGADAPKAHPHLGGAAHLAPH